MPAPTPRAGPAPRGAASSVSRSTTTTRSLPTSASGRLIGQFESICARQLRARPTRCCRPLLRLSQRRHGRQRGSSPRGRNGLCAGNAPGRLTSMPIRSAVTGRITVPAAGISTGCCKARAMAAMRWRNSARSGQTTSLPTQGSGFRVLARGRLSHTAGAGTRLHPRAAGADHLAGGPFRRRERRDQQVAPRLDLGHHRTAWGARASGPFPAANGEVWQPWALSMSGATGAPPR